ncbi:O-antigen ligase family protein [Merdimonas faecis]|uniref:O-antigen ligase family protein n=1 Tax=Merdimonas faecis TaxID=1653435 RepID=UPI0023F6A2DC|nr:O-antigen ligase family protein [Merdimonas faecis]
MKMKSHSLELPRIFTGIVGLYILSYILPSGELFGMPVQKMVVILLLGMAWIFFVKEKKIVAIIKKSKLEIVVAVAGGLGLLYSVFMGNNLGIMFAGLLYINVFVFFTIVHLIDLNMIEKTALVYMILGMISIKMVEKIVVELMFVSGQIDYDGVSQLYFSIFNTEATTMTMNFGSVELVRIQSASDIIVFLLLPFFLLMSQVSNKMKAGLLVLYSIFSMIVFSRLYLLLYCGFLFVFFIYYRKKISWKVWGVTGGVFILSAFFWLKPFASMIAFRFFSSFAVESDSVRWIQAKELLEGIRQHLWLGNGMGGYIEDYIRNTNIPFAYELEYLSFIYQLGIIGFVCIITGIICIYIKHFLPILKGKELLIMKFVTVLCFFWLWVRPLFNPSFLGLQNGFPLIGMYLIDRAWLETKG